MFCPKCGNQTSDSASFCPKCGEKLKRNEVIQETTETAKEFQQVSFNDAVIPDKTGGGLHSVTSLFMKIGSISLTLVAIYAAIIGIFGGYYSPIIVLVGLVLGVIGIAARVIDKLLRKSKILAFMAAGVALAAVITIAVALTGGNDKYVQMVKGGYLDGYPQKTVGQAFDDFLTNPKWESGLTEDDERFVNVKGGTLYLDKEVELVVQFFVNEDDETFSYNASEVNGVPQNNLIFWSLLETIYNDDSTSTSVKGVSSEITEDEALKIAQQFLDDHPLYERTIVGIGEHSDISYDNADVNDLHRIHIIDNDGVDKTMWVHRDTGDVFISRGDRTLLSGEEFYEIMYLNSSSTEITEEKAQEIIEAWLVENPIMEGQLTEVLLFDIQEINGNKYYDFTPFYDLLTTYISLIVDAKDGLIFFWDYDGEKLIPIDKWYQEVWGGVPHTPDYSGHIDDSYQSFIIDPDLVGGRWRDPVNGYYIELSSDGNSINTNLNVFHELDAKYPISVQMETYDGRLTIHGTSSIPKPYEIQKDGDRALLNYAGALFYRKDGTGDGINALVGDWVPANNETMNYYIFNSDGTCLAGNNILREEFGTSGSSFEWYTDGVDLVFVFREQVYYDYLVQGDTLTLFTQSGSISFVRIGG